MRERENGLDKQAEWQDNKESFVHILHLKSVLNGNRPRPTALKDNMHRLGRVGRFTPNPALPTDQPLRGSWHNKCFLFPQRVFIRMLMRWIPSPLSEISWVKKWLLSQQSLRGSWRDSHFFTYLVLLKKNNLLPRTNIRIYKRRRLWSGLYRFLQHFKSLKRNVRKAANKPLH